MTPESDCNSINSAINLGIHRFLEYFDQYPDYFLTEEDARTHLCRMLLEQENIAQHLQTADNSFSLPIHSEVRWYGTTGKLKLRSDLVLLEVSSLETRKLKGFKLPSKGYGFNNFYAAIEIKLRRRNGESDKAFLKKICYDIQKLKTLKQESEFNDYREEYGSYLIILDKKGDIEESIPHEPENTIRVFYRGYKN